MLLHLFFLNELIMRKNQLILAKKLTYLSPFCIPTFPTSPSSLILFDQGKVGVLIFCLLFRFCISMLKKSLKRQKRGIYESFLFLIFLLFHSMPVQPVHFKPYKHNYDVPRELLQKTVSALI